MQSLHRGSFLRTGMARNPLRVPKSIRRDVRRETRRDPGHFSPYLHIVYHKALSGTYQKIHQVSAKGC